MSRKNLLSVVEGAGLLLGVLFVAALMLPIIQSIGYAVLFEAPALLWWTGIGIALGTGAAYKGHLDLALALVALFAVIGLIGLGLSGVYAQEHIYENQQFEEKAELPETGSEHVRVLPRNVADQYAESSNQIPKYRVGESNIAYNDGTYTWSYPVVPDRFAVSWFGNQWGAYYVDMERTGRSVTTSQTKMNNGLGQVFFDSFGYQTHLNKLGAAHQPDTTFVFEHENETHIAKSYTNHEWHFRFLPIPQPYAVPKYGGTLVVDSDGNIQDMSPEEVAESEMLEGQNTYPYDLARFRMQSVQYKKGIANKIFVGDEVPKIADTGGYSDNEQPFTVPVKDGDSTPELEYFIAASPAGSGGSVYQIYQIDGQTGEIEYVEFDENRAGPQKAAGFTRSQNREPTWAVDGGSTQITEPIPSMIDGELYWHMRVTPSDGSRISYTTFVNASSGNVYRADTTEEIVSFIESSGDQSDTGGSESNESSVSNDLITVSVIEDGEVVDTFTVQQNQSMVVEGPSATSNTTETVEA